MNDEWILEYRDVNGWRESNSYKYDLKKGIDVIQKGVGVTQLVKSTWHTFKDRYRLRHIPTGKIIPGELL